MRKLTYFAIFEPNGNGGYGVYFPDILGCTSYGDNYDIAFIRIIILEGGAVLCYSEHRNYFIRRCSLINHDGSIYIIKLVGRN